MPMTLLTIAHSWVESVPYRGPVAVQIAKIYYELSNGAPGSVISVKTSATAAHLSASRLFRAEVLRVLRVAGSIGPGEYELVPEPTRFADVHRFLDLRQGGISILRDFYIT